VVDLPLTTNILDGFKVCSSCKNICSMDDFYPTVTVTSYYCRPCQWDAKNKSAAKRKAKKKALIAERLL
jgi:hypothetical protein